MGNRASTPQDPEPGTTKKPTGVAAAEGLGMIHLPTMVEVKETTTCCSLLCKITIIILSVYICLHAIGAIAVTCIAANTIKALGNEFSSRVVGLIILTGTCAVTFCASLYIALAVCTSKSSKSLLWTASVLLLMAIVQALVTGLMLPIGDQGAVDVARSLSETFKLAKDNNVKYIKVWDSVQSSLSCCGVYGAQDYVSHRVPNFFAPEVPASCCPEYDPSRSDQAQEKTREICRARKTYYTMGCMSPAIDGASAMITYVNIVMSGFIILEVILAVITGIIGRKSLTCLERFRKK